MANKVCIYVGPLANLIRGYFYVIYRYTHIILVKCLNVSFAKEEIKENPTTIPQLSLQQVFHGLDWCQELYSSTLSTQQAGCMSIIEEEFNSSILH